jgi:hypothetical protein
MRTLTYQINILYKTQHNYNLPSKFIGTIDD